MLRGFSLLFKLLGVQFLRLDEFCKILRQLCDYLGHSLAKWLCNGPTHNAFMDRAIT
jgi:hypothetical protein